MRWQFYLFLMLSVFSATPALSHGVAIAHRKASAVEIRATYDNGEPMANAQVKIYAPNNPTEPWLQGTTREDGTFVFIPNSELSGDWDIQVRQAGHGNLVTVPVAPVASSGETPDSPQPEQASSDTWQGGTYTPLQKIVMAVLGIWGFLGTALFFARNQDQN